MEAEISDAHRRILRWERRNFVGAGVAALVSVLSIGIGNHCFRMKAKQLTAAGLWPMQYSKALVPLAEGFIIGALAALIAIFLFIFWLRAIGDRRRLARVECATSALFQR